MNQYTPLTFIYYSHPYLFPSPILTRFTYTDPFHIPPDVDYALEQLGTDYIDIIVLCRCNPAVPIEESIRAMQVGNSG